MLSGCNSRAPDAAHAKTEQTHKQEEYDDHEPESVTLSAIHMKAQGIELTPLSGGIITTHLTLPAEIGLNHDTLVHVTPRVPGVAKEILAFLGDDVESGEILAVLESFELGEVKIALLQALEHQTTASAELLLQQTIAANTERLLELLHTEPELTRLRNEATNLRIGANKGRLITAYARLRAAEANFARERTLRDKGLSTEADLLAAEEAYNSAVASYTAVFEEIAFTYQVRLDTARRAASVATSSVENAERRLYLLGLSETDVEGIANEPTNHIARYQMSAPISGRIIDKHLTPGEKVDTDHSIYTIADLSTIWLNIAVYEKYLDQIEEGQSVVVHAPGRDGKGTVTYISSILNEGTRTMTAQVVLDNSQRHWVPGEFLTVRIETGQVPVARRVPIQAVQQWEGASVVFVRKGDTFVPRPVQLGRQNSEFVEVIDDTLALGTPVVAKNSFLIKAELGKSSAGHSH